MPKTLIQKLIDRYNNDQYYQPKYTIKDLYCGKIEYYITKQISDLETTFVKSDKPFKDFAIFYKNKDSGYTHIKSNIFLYDENDSSKISGYFVSNIKPFEQVYGEGLKLLGLTKKSKISKAFIEYLETKGNKKHNISEMEI